MNSICLFFLSLKVDSISSHRLIEMKLTRSLSLSLSLSLISSFSIEQILFFFLTVRFPVLAASIEQCLKCYSTCSDQAIFLSGQHTAVIIYMLCHFIVEYGEDVRHPKKHFCLYVIFRKGS